MFSGEKGRTLFALGVCILASIIGLLVIAYLPGGKNVSNSLFVPISFSGLANAALNELGLSGVLVGLSGFFTLAAFFTAVPSSGGFAGQGTRVAGLFFLQQMLFFPFIFILLLSPDSAVSLLPYIIPFGIVMALAGEFIKDDLQYQEFQDSKSGEVGRTFRMSSRRFVGANAVVLVILTEAFYAVKFDPTLPLFGWVFLLYIVFFAVLQAAFTYGLVFQLINAKQVTIVPSAGENIEGYLVSRGEDHVLVRTTNNERLLIPMSSISRIIVPERRLRAEPDPAKTPELIERKPPALEQKDAPKNPADGDGAN